MVKLSVARLILEPAHGGLSGKGLFLSGTNLQDTVISQRVAIVTVFVSCRYLHNLLAQHRHNRMFHVSLMTSIVNACRKSIDQPDLVIHLIKQ